MRVPEMMHRARRYPAGFVVAHPVRVARNLVGNHPSKLADRYLSGLRGIEIGGAAHNTFFLDTINVDLNASPSTTADQLRHAGRTMPIDLLAPAGELPCADSAYEFVLASHVLEHVPDAIGALKEWLRVASRYVFLILPAPDNQFDLGRPLSTVQELLERHRAGFASEDDVHWSVWSSETFVELCRELAVPVLEVQDPDDKRGNGFAVVLDAAAYREP
jgi:hypothetical protein